MTDKLKVLFLDIETSPYEGKTWGKYDQNVLRFTKYRELLSVAYKWQGEKEIRVYSRQGEKSDYGLVLLTKALINKADIVIAHNGDQFDIRVIRARIAFHNIKGLRPLTTVDTRKSAKKYFDFPGNSLDDLLRFFGIGHKMHTVGIQMWLDCEANCPKAWAKLLKYNKSDVQGLEKVYDRMKPYIENHPNIARMLNPKAKGVCPICSSSNASPEGMRGLQQRWCCNDCGKWYTTAVKKNG